MSSNIPEPTNFQEFTAKQFKVMVSKVEMPEEMSQVLVIVLSLRMSHLRCKLVFRSVITELLTEVPLFGDDGVAPEDFLKNSKNFLEESILETVLEIYPEFRWYIQCFENENPIDLVQHIHNIDIRFRDLVNDLGGNYFLIYVKDLKNGMSYFLYLSCVKKPVANDVNESELL